MRSRMCTVHERRTAVLRMMGCLLQGVMNLYPPSASLKDSRITLCHNRVDTHNAHTPPPLPVILALKVSCVEGYLGPFL